MPNKMIFSTSPLPREVITTLESLCGKSVATTNSDHVDELLEKAGPVVEILLLSKNRWLDKSKIQLMPELRFVQTLSAGVDSLDFEVIPKDVLVCGNVGAYSEPVAQHVFAMILCLAKNLVVRNEELRKGVFNQTPDGVFLQGKSIGIVGAGAIGQAVARLAKAFGMMTLGINSSGEKKSDFFDKVDNVGGLDLLLSQADVVVISLPLTIKTLDLINKSKLALMKSNAILINVGRAPIVNEKALFEQLNANPSFKAGSDVWWVPRSAGKPFSQHFPFFNLPNFLGSPHIADAVPESEELAINNAVRNIERYVKGEPLKGLANREDYLELEQRVSKLSQ